MTRNRAHAGVWSLKILDGENVVAGARWWSREFEHLVYDHVDALTVVDQVRRSLLGWWSKVPVLLLLIALDVAVSSLSEDAGKVVRLFWWHYLLLCPLPDAHTIVSFREDGFGGDEFFIVYEQLKVVDIKSRNWGAIYHVDLGDTKMHGGSLLLTPSEFASFYASLHRRVLDKTGRRLDEYRFIYDVPPVGSGQTEAVSGQGAAQRSVKGARSGWRRSRVLWWSAGLLFAFVVLAGLLVKFGSPHKHKHKSLAGPERIERINCDSYIGQASKSLRFFPHLDVQPLPYGFLVKGMGQCVIHAENGVVWNTEFCGSAELDVGEECSEAFGGLLLRAKGK